MQFVRFINNICVSSRVIGASIFTIFLLNLCKIAREGSDKRYLDLLMNNSYKNFHFLFYIIQVTLYNNEQKITRQ